MNYSNYCVFIILLSAFQCTLQLPGHDAAFNETDACECGRPWEEIEPRIIGGDDVDINDYPWMVAMITGGKLFCGGTLINDRYILTAGHCLNQVKPDRMQVVMGVTDFRNILKGQKLPKGSELKIQSIIIHENFTSYRLYDKNDIGLIKLAEPIDLTQKVRPVCMPHRNSVYANKEGLVVGWGKIRHHGTGSAVLRRASLKVLRNDKCRHINRMGVHVTNSMLCAYQQGKDACQGDSGGPLLYENENGKMEQIGIVSWGRGCAKPGFPGVYSRMTSYVDWVRKHTQDALYCSSL